MSDFTLEKGEDAQADYLWGKRHIHHLFCKTCGVRSYAKGDFKSIPMASVNVRCLDDVTDITKLTVQYNDGAVADAAGQRPVGLKG